MNPIENILNKVILYHNAPTLLGLKPATLVNFTSSNRLYTLWRHYSKAHLKRLLADLELSTVLNFEEIHHQTGSHILVLFYHPEMLKKNLLAPENQDFLISRGYPSTLTINEYLNQLSQRIGYLPEFPHEIGIFLGFPLRDVQGFIKNHGKNYIFNQYWKVYHNPLTAKKIFASYDCAKINLLQKFKKTKV